MLALRDGLVCPWTRDARPWNLAHGITEWALSACATFGLVVLGNDRAWFANAFQVHLEFLEIDIRPHESSLNAWVGVRVGSVCERNTLEFANIRARIGLRFALAIVTAVGAGDLSQSGREVSHEAKIKRPRTSARHKKANCAGNGREERRWISVFGLGEDKSIGNR